jgi:hypothetical protein
MFMKKALLSGLWVKYKESGRACRLADRDIVRASRRDTG